MIIHHVLAVIAAYFIDLVVGDPPNWPHPVKWMGKIIDLFDRRLNHGRHRRMKGFFMLASLLSIVLAVSVALIYLFYQWHLIAGILAEGILISTAITQRSLKKAACEVLEPLQEGNMEAARRKLSYIVGRDTDHLSKQEVVRGTVETVAENTSDGVTAPLFWALIGGAPLALLYRAVNTCDSMVGYKNARYREFGWASARFDDVLNWVPARLTAYMTLLSGKPKVTTLTKAWAVLRRDARKHNSPNSGWGEASVAAILGIQLGGTNYYQGVKSESPTIGDPLHPLNTQHIVQAVTIMQRTVWLFLAMLIIGGVLYELAVAWF